MSSPIAGISPASIRTIEPLVTGGAQASGGGDFGLLGPL